MDQDLFERKKEEEEKKKKKRKSVSCLIETMKE
jgi:hypothetical protein